MSQIAFVPTRLNDLPADVLLAAVARGDIFYRGASKWNNLAAGPSGQVLTSTGPGGELVWAPPGPVLDSEALVKGSSDASKQVRLEVDGLSPATTRVMTVPDADGTLATTAFVSTATKFNSAVSTLTLG